MNTDEKKEAIEAGLRFIHAGRQPEVEQEWSARGFAAIHFFKADFERMVKLVLVGMGELSK